MRLCVGYEHSQFWPILTRFVDYYSLFWGPRVISTINEPRCAFTCRSLTLIVLADYGPFRGLLLIVLVSRSDSTINKLGVHLRVAHQHSRFWPILNRFKDYYSLSWGPGVMSTSNKPQRAVKCRSSALTILADSGTFCALLLTVVGSRSDFHD